MTRCAADRTKVASTATAHLGAIAPPREHVPRVASHNSSDQYTCLTIGQEALSRMNTSNCSHPFSYLFLEVDAIPTIANSLHSTCSLSLTDPISPFASRLPLFTAREVMDSPNALRREDPFSVPRISNPVFRKQGSLKEMIWFIAYATCPVLLNCTIDVHRQRNATTGSTTATHSSRNIRVHRKTSAMENNQVWKSFR